MLKVKNATVTERKVVIRGTDSELAVLAAMINEELVWSAVEEEYGIPASFLEKFHNALNGEDE